MENLSAEKGKILFPRTLTKAIFIERPNRFLLRCKLLHSNEEVLVHLPDPGRLKELLVPETIVWLLENNDPNRKTKWTAVLCENEMKTGLVSINTTYPNQLIKIVLQEEILEELKGWHYKRAEYKLGHSRWDFLLENDENEQMLLEVKSVTLAKNGRGMFPDAVTKRGTRHVQELSSLAEEGTYKAAILFVVQREDVDFVTPAYHIDKDFASALKKAKEAGVLLLARTCKIREDSIEIGEKVPVLTHIGENDRE